MIAADIAMQQLDKEGEVDLLRVLSSLRQDRGGMIQTKQQYVFLHQVRKNFVQLKKPTDAFIFSGSIRVCQTYCNHSSETGNDHRGR